VRRVAGNVCFGIPDPAFYQHIAFVFLIKENSDYSWQQRYNVGIFTKSQCVFCEVGSKLFIFFVVQQPLVDHGLLIIEASHSHLVELLWTTDQPVTEKSTLTTHNTHKRQTSIPPAGFEPAIPASERSQTHAIDRAASGIGLENTV
jgi:hypothetical protein